MTDFLNPNHDFSSLPAGKAPSPTPDGVDRHVPVPKSLQEASDILTTIGQEPTEPMDGAVKARQRAALVAHASHLAPHTPSVAPTPSIPSIAVMPSADQTQKGEKKTNPHHPWRGFVFGFAGVLAAVALVLVFVSPDGFRPLPGARPLASALAIPAAHAGDAFLLVADKSDASGVSSDSTLTITSKVDVSPEVLKQSLRIEPPIDVDVVKEGTGIYKVTPRETLAAGETYRVSIETLVDQEDGTRLRREFSWALQAKNDMRVLSTIPRDGSSQVPVLTGIEFKLSRDGWTDATSSFSIIPATEGRFEARGRFLTFIPKMPFEAGRRYDVTLKQGFGASEGDPGLKEDIKIRFETAVPTPSGPYAKPSNVKPPIQFSAEEFQEKRPNTPWQIGLGWSYSPDELVKAEIVGYRLDPAEAERLLVARLQVPTWAPIEAGRFEAYEKAVKTEAFRAEVDTLIVNYRREAGFPATPAGFYAVRLTPKAPQGGKPSWVFLQVTDVASYLVADKDRFFAWTVNPSTNRALSNLRVRLAGQDKRTDARGLVELETPKVLRDTSVKAGDVYPFELITYGDGTSELAAFGLVRRAYDGYWFELGNRDATYSKTWSYLYTDRPLYHQSDELKLFGVAQDRDSSQGVGEVEVRLRKSTYWFDWGTGEDKVYQRKTIRTDAAGRFDASFDWKNLSQGYYSIEVRRGSETVSSRSFEVREFAKPAYAITVTMDKDEVYDGDAITGTLKASFYEGTPMPKLKVKLSWNDGGATTVETDDAGMARVTLPYRLPACKPASEDRTQYCSSTVWLTVSAVPEGGEEGEIFGLATVMVHRSEAGVNFRATADRKSATVNGRVWRRVLGAYDEGRSQAWANRPVTLVIYGRRWEQVQTGFRYDPIEKKQTPMYRYEERWDEPVTAQLITDARGGFTHTFPVDETRDYYLIAETRDDKGRLSESRTWAYPDSYGGRPSVTPGKAYQEPVYPSLEITPKPPENGPYGFGVGEEVTATYLMGDKPLEVAKTPGILFVTASRGLRSAVVTESSDYKVRFDQTWIPNAELRAVTWVNGKFEVVQTSIDYRREDKALVVEAKPRKVAYAPGETVDVDVTVRSQSTNAPAHDTVVAFSAVDKALLSLTYDEKANPLYGIYGYVADGIIFSSRSHDEGYDGFGGAEKGGGGGEAARAAMAVRKNFKDTAAFGTVKTDADGKATIRFTAPDNITGWRLELIGVSAGLDAGAVRVDVNVTKPVFVDVVAPPRLLTNDKPYLKLRAYGAGLANGDAVTFTVKAPSLGIDESVQGRAGQPISVGISHLIDGRHAVTVYLESAKGTDAIEREVLVVPSRFLRDEFVRVDAAPGSALPDLGRPEATIQFVPQNRAALQPLAYDLVSTWSSRSDALIASRLATKLLREEFKIGTDRWWGDWLPKDADLARRIGEYQDEAGGIRLLSYGSADLELSAEVAATAPDSVDRDSLAGYFWLMLDDKGASREVQIQALAGLAALGEPVLPSLQAAAAMPDLGWREQLAVARGLEAVGDRERARSILETLLGKAERRDEVTHLAVSENVTESYEATADAAGLAARLAHPEADNLSRYVETNWRAGAFPVLAKARYLAAVLPTRANRDITLAYTLGEGESVLTFKEGAVQSVELTADEAARFRVTRVDGPVAILFLSRVAGRPESKPELSVGRRYEADRPLAELKEGDVVRITLVPEFRGNAQDGCYAVRDHLPGAFQAVVGWGASEAYQLGRDAGYSWYPSLVEDGEVTFTACKYGGGNQDYIVHPITYTSRVVTRGTYTAEAPVIQHEEYPAVAAVGQDQTIEIK